jgi:F420H(2)-dependent quinone reductase
MRTGTRLHIALYRASGGRIAGRAWGLPILLLGTTGRRSGKKRTTPLCYLVDGERLVVIASNGGMDWTPAWWLNLSDAPQVTIQTGRTQMAVRAREAVPGERERLWAEVTAIAPGYLKYEARTKRKIPLGILEPI